MSELSDTAPAVTDTAPSEGVQTTGFNFAPEYANNPSITKFNGDVNNLAKSYLSLQSMMGQEKIPVPKGDDDVNAWGMYNKAFGVPEAPEGYEINTPQDLGFEFDSNVIKNIAHQARLSPAQAQKITDLYLNDIKEQFTKSEQESFAELKKQAEGLKTEWGMKYEENIALAKNYLRSIAGSNRQEYDRLNEKYGNDVDAIKIFAKAGASITEGSLGGFEGQAGGFTKTPEQASQELNKIMEDSNDPYWAGARNRRNDMTWARENRQGYVSEEERKARVEYVNSLMQMAGQG